MRRTKKYIIVMLFIIIVVLLQGCTQQNKKHTEAKQGARPSTHSVNPNSNSSDTSIVNMKTKKSNLIDKTYQVKLSAIGDVLIHSSVYKDAKTQTGYDFKPMFTLVKPLIIQSDIVIANEESIMGGESLGLSDYPQFNSPYAIGDALKDMGINVVTMANNHTLDHSHSYGDQAIKNANHYYDQLGIIHTGAFESVQDQNTIRTITKNHITFSILAYTFGTNGLPFPKGKPYLVNLINLDKMGSDIQRAKSLSDVVVVCLHFGYENHRMPNSSQEKIAHAVAEAGADIILGTHPHVLEPTAWIQTKSGKKTFVAYSLGNFISGQDQLYENIGGILQLTVEKKVKGMQSTIAIHHPSMTLTWVQKIHYRHYKVIPLQQVTDKQLPHVTTIRKKMMTDLSQWMPDLKVY